MNGLNRMFLIGALLLIVGVVWAFTMNGIGAKEWSLLLVGTAMGIIGGIIQAKVIFLKNRGKIGSSKMKMWITGTILVFVAVKVALNTIIPTYLATNIDGIWVSIVFAVGGFLLGRSYYSRLSGVSAA
ncbi:hypothetical protein [Cohnella soli]|uniref:DUF2178 domain-containing protein n=1 Tax=Cohnella soli TaxID=425005 RepID=A0ABW0I2U5_9BACL